MFWKYNNTSSPHIEAMLQKEGVTLQELMDEDDIIQECKLQNKKLVEFLCQRNVLEELVTFITEEPSEELDERTRFKYPNIACELLTCDVPALNESLSSDNELLEKLYSFIDRDPPLNPLLASFLSRTLGVLIVKRLDQWISYQLTCLQAMGFLKDKENFISLLLKHLATSAIMDLTLKLITEVGEEEHRLNILDWLDSQTLVQSLIALFDPNNDSERHHNASQLICDVLRLSRENINDHRPDTDPIVARLEAPETVSLLLDRMLGSEKSESSIVGGIQVLLALLDRKHSFSFNNLTCTYDGSEFERRQKLAQSTAQVILERLKDFHNILLDPPKKAAVRTTLGVLDPPLGNTRLQVTKLLAALIGVNSEEIMREIANLGTIEVLLDLFFKYGWNNFLHADVQQCIASALVSKCKPNESENTTCDNAVYPYLFVKCRLLGRILEAWDDNEQKQTKPKGIRQGYMGHLINIANNIVEQCETNDSLDKYITENVSKDTLEAWNNLVNGSLAEIRKTQRIILGGVHPNSMASEDSNDEFNIPYPQNAVLPPQMYNEFQMQQVAPEIIENYGFHDDEFSDPDDSMHALERRTNMNMLGESEMTRQAELFKKVCSSYINTLDDADDSIFEEQAVTSRTIKPSTENNWNPREPSADDEGTVAETRMDVDPWSGPPTNRTTIPIPETNDPWSNMDSSAMTGMEDGWADFGSFATNFNSPMKSSSEIAVDANKNTSDKCEAMQINNIEQVVDNNSVHSMNGADTEMKPAANEAPPLNAEVNRNESTAPETPTDNQESLPNVTCPVEMQSTTSVADSNAVSDAAAVTSTEKTQVETVTETPAETVTEALAETVTETLAETVTETPADTVAETPAEPEPVTEQYDTSAESSSAPTEEASSGPEPDTCSDSV